MEKKNTKRNHPRRGAKINLTTKERKIKKEKRKCFGIHDINIKKILKMWKNLYGADIHVSNNGIEFNNFLDEQFKDKKTVCKLKDWEKKFNANSFVNEMLKDIYEQKDMEFFDYVEFLKFFKFEEHFGLRAWQKKGFHVFDLIKNNHPFISLAASVSSGKTLIAAYAFGKHIIECKKENITSSFQSFVVPRVALGKQQYSDIKYYLEKMFNFKDGIDYNIFRVDYMHKEFNKDKFCGGHVIVVICDESLWGTDKNSEFDRFNGWIHSLNEYNKKSISLGHIFYDEAHNYDTTTRDKDDKEKVIRRIKRLQEYFKSSILASGTPGPFQKEMSIQYAKYAIKCSVRETIENKWALKPIINLVVTSERENFAAAVKAVYENEIKKVSEDRKKYVRILVNCHSIDEIYTIANDEWFVNGVKNGEFNVITIHTLKKVKINNKEVELTSMINYTEKTKDEVFDKLNEELDDNKIFKGKRKDLPIFLFQCDTISEGVNLKSFNAVVVTSINQQKVMQQIGRVMRKWTDPDNKEYEKEQANVYVFIENNKAVTDLMQDLSTEYDLNSDCFEWGKYVLIKKGSGPEIKDNAVPALIDPKWEEINDSNRPQIIDNIVKDVNSFTDEEITNAWNLYTKLYFVDMKIDSSKNEELMEKYIRNDAWKSSRSIAEEFLKELQMIEVM